MRIRIKAYLSFLLVGVVLTFSGVLVYHLFFSYNYEQAASDHIKSIAAIKESSINLLLENKKNEGSGIAALSIVNKEIDNIDPDDFYRELSAIVNKSPEINDVLLVNNKGNVLFATNQDAPEILSNPDDQILLTRSVGVISNIRKDDDGFYYYVSHPVLGFSHYLLIKYNTNSLLQILNEREGLKFSGEALLVTEIEDRAYFVNEQKFVSSGHTTSDMEEIIAKVLEGNRGYVANIKDYRREEVMLSYLKVDSINSGLIVKIDRSEALNFVDRMVTVSLTLGIAIMLFLYAVVSYLSRRLTKPIEELHDAVEIVADGNWDYNINITGDDELAETAQAFHKMAQTAKKAMLKSDKQIEDQTKNLRDQQMAILNILEDVEVEKEKAAESAKELEKFQQAVENASDHIVITDAEGKVIYANPAVTKITGFSREEVMGTKVGTGDNWGGLMGEEFYNNLWATIKKEKKSFSGYINNVRKNGEKYEALANISPVFDAGGNVIFFVGIERDFTKEREIDRAKSEFVSLASHQLRTPLSTVNWYAEILLSEDAGKINDEQREYIDEIYKGNQRMVNLVNALLNVSRIDLGTLSIEPEMTDLTELADSVIKELELKTRERNHKIVKVFEKDIPKINLDPKMMRIVWQNYLTNAVKYTPRDGTIEIGMKKKDKVVEIYVKDNGMGIPEKQQDKIFNKLFRADNAMETETDGTGLGLYIVKSIIEEFGGKVWFESKENEGTTFFATIPLRGVKAKAGSKGLEYTG